MNKDVEQVKRFITSFRPSGKEVGDILHKYTQSNEGITPEEAYIQITSFGEREGTCNNVVYLDKLLNAKRVRDLQKKQWTEGLRDGWSTIQDFEEENPEDLDIAFDCMKDIIKTTDRLQEIQRLGFPNSVNAITNRNWFMDKLNIKLPEDAHDCYTCKEAFWKTGKYIKNNE